MRGKLAAGAAWAVIGFAAAQLLRFVGNLVLTRLLLPDAFGVMVLVNTFIVGLALFSDIGIGASVVQHKRGTDPAFLNTAWTLSVVRGFAITVIASLCAWPLALLYDVPELSLLLPVASLSALALNAQSMRVALASRQLNVRRLTLIELISQGVGMTAMIVGAEVWHSVWALVIGGVLGAFAQLALSFVAFPPPRDRLTWDKTAVREIIRFGKWVLASTALMYASNNLDRFIFGKLVALTMLGFYNQALNLALIAAAGLGQLGQRIIFPYFSAVVTAGGDLVAQYRRARWPMLCVGGWAVSGLIVGGPAAVAFLYPDVYAPSGVMLQILAVASWFGVVLEGPNGAALLAQGKPRMTAAGSLAKVVVMIPGLFIGGSLGRALSHSTLGAFAGALCGLVLADAARYVVSTWAVRRSGMKDLRVDALLSLAVVVSAAAGLFIQRLLDHTLLADAALAFHRALPAVSSRRALGLFDGILAAVVITALWSPLLRSAWRQRHIGWTA